MKSEGHRVGQPRAARHELHSIERELEVRTERLERAWRAAPIADRLLAVQRLLVEGDLSIEQRRDVEDLNLHVQRLWTELRSMRRASGDALHRLRALAVEGELEKAEHARDSYLDDEVLVEALFSVAETFFVPYSRDALPYRELVRRRDDLQARLPAPKPALPADRTQEIPMARVFSLTGEIISAAA